MYLRTTPRFTELPDPDPLNGTSEQRSAIAFLTAGQVAA